MNKKLACLLAGFGLMVISAVPNAMAQRVTPLQAGKFLQLCKNPKALKVCDAYISGISDSVAYSKIFAKNQGDAKAPAGFCIAPSVYGIIGTALLQGILTGCGLALFNIPEPVLLGGIAAFLSLFPIGAPVVWIPAVIWLAFYHHHVISAILLLTYGIIIISGVEHVIRPMFVSSGNKLPYLLSVLGILGGVLAFGGLGIFLGPVLLGLGYTLTLEFSKGKY